MMKNFVIRVLLCIFALTLSGPLVLTRVAHAQPSEIYVATAANGGSDATGTGTMARPYNTIRRATYGNAGSWLKPGSTIYLRGGTYYPTVHEVVFLECSGVSGNPITIKSFGSEWAIIDGSNLPNGNNPLLVVPASYVKIQSLEIRNSKGYGVYLTGNNDEVWYSSINNSYAGGLRASQSSGHLVQECSFFNNVKRNSSRVLVNGGWESSLESYKSSNVRFHKNNVYENWGEGILLQNSQNCYVTENTARDNMSTNIYLDACQNVTVDNNTTTCTWKTAHYKSDGTIANGIMLANEWPNAPSSPNNAGHTISNNRISNANRGIFKWSGGNGGGGMTNTGISGNTIQYCITARIDIQSASPGGHAGSWIYSNRYGSSWATTLNYAGISNGSNTVFAD